MNKEGRYLLERIVNWWDDEKEFIGDFVEEIRAYLAEPEKKREPMSEEKINAKMAEYFLENDIQFRFGFMEGVYFAEKHHGIGGEDAAL